MMRLTVPYLSFRTSAFTFETVSAGKVVAGTLSTRTGVLRFFILPTLL
jgi:hypothetical protein